MQSIQTEAFLLSVCQQKDPHVNERILNGNRVNNLFSLTFKGQFLKADQTAVRARTEILCLQMPTPLISQ